ncbi:MAG: LysR family transcriptional regulator [Deltaproteobacteria bacterium]|nr:LysR family transcriptional regulator [Deltaproteobacteria bacterium]
MNLNQLKIFYFTAKCGRLSLAAEELKITQPAVTKGIQRFQSHYGIKFFNLFGKKLVLTDAGKVLFEIAEEIFELESQAEESIRDFQHRQKGHIRIDASEAFGAYYLPPTIIAFSKLYPKIKLSVNIMRTESVVANAASLNCDLGFTSYPVNHKKVVIKKIMEDNLLVITPPDHPLAKKENCEARDLEGQLLVTHEKGSATYNITEAYLKKHHITVLNSLELSSNETVTRVVAEGAGIAIVSSKIAKKGIEAGRIAGVPLRDNLKRTFYMVYHKDKYISDTLQSFMDLLGKWLTDYSRGADNKEV